MLRRLWLLLLLGASCTLGIAQNSQLTGTMVGPDGTPFTGFLRLQLTQPGAVAASVGCGGASAYLVLPTITTTVQVSGGAMTSPPKVWGADCMSPTNVPYAVTVQDVNGNTLYKDYWLIQGSTFNIGTAQSQIPTTPINVLAISGLSTTTTTLAPGSTATSTAISTGGNQWMINFGLPQGANGATGPAGPTGPTGPGGAPYAGCNAIGSIGVNCQSLGGNAYASQLTTGSGNNGIFNCITASSNPTCVADFLYGTEKAGLFNYSTTQFHYTDKRPYADINYYRNPEYLTPNPLNWTAYPTAVEAGNSTFCNFDNTRTWSGTTISQTCNYGGQLQLDPGINLGNPSGGGVTGLGSQWKSTTSNMTTSTAYGQGIFESNTIFQYKNSVGDNALMYGYLHGHGGATDPSGEQNKVYADNMAEDLPVALSCISGCSNGTVGSTAIVTSIANGTQGVGRYVINQGETPVSGHITAQGTGLTGTSAALTIDTTVATSNAWGTIATGTPISINPSNTPPFTTSVSFNVNVNGGTFVTTTLGTTTGLLCFGGGGGTTAYHDQVQVTSVTNAGGPVATLTALVKYPHGSGTLVMQGGVCGTGVEATAYTTLSGVRYTVDVIGSTTGTDLQMVAFRAGGVSGNPFSGVLTQSATLSTTLTQTGTTIVGSFNGGSLVFPFSYFGKSFLISGASDSNLNVVCSNMQPISTTQFSCTNTVNSGTFTNVTNVPTATLNINGFNLWHTAEVLDVRNTGGTYTLSSVATASGGHTVYTGTGLTNACANPGNTLIQITGFTNSLNNGTYSCSASASTTITLNSSVGAAETHAATATVPVQVDGTFALEPNIIPYGASTTIVETNHYSSGWINLSMANGVNNPLGTSLVSMIYMNITGTGMSGGSGSTSSGTAIKIENNQTNTNFFGAGGFISPLNAFSWKGPLNIGFNFGWGPTYGQPFMLVSPDSTSQINNRAYNYYLFEGFHKTSAFTIQDTPYTGDVAISTNRILTLTGVPIFINSDLGNTTLRGQLTFGAMLTPAAPVVTARTFGGTLADTTQYCYQIAELNSVGTTLANTTATCVTTGTSSGANSIIIDAIPEAGVTSYKLYGRTSGGELLMATNSGIANTMFVDNGSITPSGALPLTNTTLSGFVGALSGSFNSSGTAFNTTLVATASNSGNNTLTLPASTGTIALSVLSGTPTFTAGTNVTSCGCASGYTCTNTRGELTIVGGTATTGTICTVNFSATLGATPFAFIQQNGGTSLYDVGHGTPSTSGVAITAGVTVTGATVTTDYLVVP